MVRVACLIYVCINICAICYAQQNRADTTPFNGKTYTEYLASWQTVTTGGISLLDCAQIAIAAEKTNAWDGVVMVDIRNRAAGDPVVLTRIDAFRNLLGGDTKGAVIFFENPKYEPDTREAVAVIKLLRGQGYPLAGNAMEALTRDLSDARIIAWLRIPKDKREPINQNMLKRYLPSSMNRHAMVETAIKLYANPPANAGILNDDFLELAMWFGKATGKLTLTPAERLADEAKWALASRYAKRLAQEFPDDMALQRQICDFLPLCRDIPSAIARYQELLKTGKEPYLREIRLDYLERLNNGRLKPENVTMATMQQDANPLCAGDALLVAQKYPEATAQYALVLRDAGVPLARRLAAWGGMLDSDPATALAATDAILTDLDAAKNDPERSKLVVWAGWQLARLTRREIPLGFYENRLASRSAYISVSTVDGWVTSLAKHMDRLIAMDPEACLKTGTVDRPSLRFAATLIQALTGDMKKADAVSKQVITYMAAPPPGGWTTFPGSPDKDADKPRKFTSPIPGEREQVMADVTPMACRFFAAQVKDSTARIPYAPPNLDLMISLANYINMTKDNEQRAVYIREYARQFVLAVAYLDPPAWTLRITQPPTVVRDVDFSHFSKLRATVNIAFKPDEAAKLAVPFLKDGLQKALLSASNLQILGGLTDITEDVLDRYGAAVQDQKKAEALAKDIANWLNGRKNYDMQPFALRLIEKYAPPPQPIN